jgi:uncharacterized membrane-anchored protein YhcB (DUF1043 family)
MEYVYSVWQISIISLVAGAMIGALAYRLFAPSVQKAGKIKSELDVAREELNSYKTSVNQHFNTTSELVNDLTQNYVKVYQHLAEGAQNLGDNKAFANLLEQHQGRVSIAVDDEINVMDKLADDLFVDPVVTQAASEETVDEHAEPFSDVNTGGTDPVSPEHDAAETRVSKSSVNLDGPGEAREPIINVGALEEVTESADIEVQTKAVSAVPEGEDKIEARTTVH